MSVCSLPLGLFRTNRPVRGYVGGVLPSHQNLVADWEQRHCGLCIRSQAAVCLGDTATVCGHGWFVTDVKHRPYLVAGCLASFVYDFSIEFAATSLLSAPLSSNWEVRRQRSDQIHVVYCHVLHSAPIWVLPPGVCEDFDYLSWRVLCLLAHVKDADETTQQMSWVRVGLCIKDCFEKSWSLLLTGRRGTVHVLQHEIICFAD